MSTQDPSVTECASATEVDDGPVYEPMSRTIQEIRDAIPDRLFVHDTPRAVGYLAMNIAMAVGAWTFATRIDALCAYLQDVAPAFLSASLVPLVNAGLWCAYWWFQGLIFTGFWVIAHECGHGGFSESKWLCDTVGVILQSYLLTPYYGWKISHHKHHMSHASMERDETWVPLTRSEMNIPQLEAGSKDYEEYFGDAPLYTLGVLVFRQMFAFPAYLLLNVSGNKDYPKWTNHFSPTSVLFAESQRPSVLLSDFTVTSMLCLIYTAARQFGWGAVLKYYGVPWLWVSHWLVMITYLHHTDPALPHYRKGAWTFTRGAAATMDRDFLGWQGRLFLHGISHHHVVHHFFPKMPWFNQKEATEYLKPVLGEHYHCSETPVFKAMWNSYNNCQFVEDTGSVLFYRNKQGRAARKAPEELQVE